MTANGCRILLPLGRHPLPRRGHKRNPVATGARGRVLIFLPGETLQLDASDQSRSQIESLPHTNSITASIASPVLPEMFSVRRVYDAQSDQTE